MLSTRQYLALSHKAPRPSAGKAFIDYFLNVEGTKLLAKAGELVTMKSIRQWLPGAEKSNRSKWTSLTIKAVPTNEKNSEKRSSNRGNQT